MLENPVAAQEAAGAAPKAVGAGVSSTQDGEAMAAIMVAQEAARVAPIAV